MKHLILIGLPGSGKTTVGRLAAERLGLPFSDCDTLIEVETGRFKEPPNPLVGLVSRLVNEENPSWSGTATELAQCLSEMDSSRSFTPNWIVRTLNVQQENLLRDHGVRYVSYRTKEGKALSLRWDSVR